MNSAMAPCAAGEASATSMPLMPARSQKYPAACSSGMRSSRSTRNNDPFPTSLSTSMVPPMRSTRLLVMDMPSPVPCTLLVVEFSARVNESKMVLRNSGVMP